MRELIDLLESNEKLVLNPLPYGEKDLEPVMSAATIDYHYKNLAKSYVDRFNAGEGDREFNHAGAYLHNIFFPQLQAPRGSNKPKGSIAELIDRKFGSYEDFKLEFERQAMSIQGSGWVYLSRDGAVKIIKNHAVRRDIVVLVDWWEHAWALDYQQNKKQYLKNIWRCINWDVVNQRL